MTRIGIRATLAALALVHASTLAAGLLAPYAPDEQARELANAPPTRPRWIDRDLRVHVRPFVVGLTALDAAGPPRYEEDWSRLYPVRWLVRDANDQGRLRLFGVSPPMRVFLFGADALGRDQFSRFLHGGRLSLFAGLLATVMALGIGTAVGIIAGAGGGAVDRAAMFLADVVTTLPWVYLLIGVRAVLPLAMPPEAAWIATIAVIGVVGWVRPARIVRAIVTTTASEDFVTAARAAGASPWHIWTRHLLPAALPALATQASLLLPQCVLAEVSLSFLGLGVGEPAPSWGGLLAPLQQYGVVTSAWWTILPAVALVPIFLLYYLLSRSLGHRTA